ncbi:dihydropteroate synthase [Microbacterium memoriense]|uniref:Dihydropteroate synthase n=1 Tax=Microbacterium memoriense TaxID=2978350 RepID=A0ABT2PBX8_9MICO|nr:dihydropteroate synthase [Microbacterium memoriense]MCT9001702.1 dihydropteroate synthase [Microbacterium memoriense]
MTLVMGILNVTPDSFSDGGRFLGVDEAIAHAHALAASGADIIDVGGESTRPGATRVTSEAEQVRVLDLIQAIALPTLPTISIDTMNASTALAAVAAGVRIVNDVSGGLADPDMLPAVATTDADIVLQHWRGHSADMYARAHYDDIVSEVIGELAARTQAAVDAGIPRERIILDPGFGFGKEPADNWLLARELSRLTAQGHRVLVGTSRKRMIAEVAGAGERDTDIATAVTSVLAAQAGAWAVRVHDVATTRLALRTWRAWTGSGEGS